MHPNHNQQSQPDKHGFKDEGNQTLGHSTKTEDHEQALSASHDQTKAHRVTRRCETKAAQGLFRGAARGCAQGWWSAGLREGCKGGGALDFATEDKVVLLEWWLGLSYGSKPKWKERKA